jgi:hypothetical protein
MYGFPIAVWCPENATSITVYFASGTTQGHDDLEFMLQSPNEDSPANADAEFDQVLASPCSAESASSHTSDSSTWTGSDVGTKQKKTWTIAPTESGWAVVTPILRTNDDIYICPKLEVGTS